MQIDTLEQWAEVAQYLKLNGYTLWQMQYDIDSPNGFICRFMTVNGSLPRVEYATFDSGVKDAMLRYEP